MYQTFIFLIFIDIAYTFPKYLLEIPNGFQVPDPCPSAQGSFTAVGHWQKSPHMDRFSMHRGIFDAFKFERNPFGSDFETLKGNWSLLCNKDSDGDMKSNGEELGDPHCVWSKGKKPEGPATSHPGIKEVFKNNKAIYISRTIKSIVNCEDQEALSIA
ncbi:temptin-like [Mytilus trossulus]|uniref:temptin-like n=1 Tax=Mytilus trossulus TaxID=6551 RepID=UPI003004F412